MSTLILSLTDPLATLDTVGGKGMSLAKMSREGLPVPDGFYITTDAYRQFIAANHLQPEILSALEKVDPSDPVSADRVATRIGQCFSAGIIPTEIANAITSAYKTLSQTHGHAASLPVAVRSSATAEDLPGASFAGQQETYLNRCGEEAVLSAVKECWASLWTARAIAYRARQAIAPASVALAVVIQELVLAEASGVLFTANPVNGKRTELMITATWGLGEAIVGGKVTPDTLLIEKAAGKITSRVTSAKQVMTIPTGSGTIEQPVPKSLVKSSVLSDDQAIELARLGVEIENLYGMPMDIEWTLAGGRFAVVQARPITSLPEPPLEWNRPHSKALYARGSFAEFVPDPVSPLFASLAIPIAQAESQKMMMDIVGVNENSYLVDVINGYVYIGMRMTPGMIWKMLISSTVKAKQLLKQADTRWAVVRANLKAVTHKWQQDLSALPAPDLLAGAREIFSATALYYTVGQSGSIAAAPFSEIVFSSFYSKLIKRKPDPAPAIFLLGFNTLPLCAEKSLYDLSLWVNEQPELAKYLRTCSTGEICVALNSTPIPAPLAGEFAQRLSTHLANYGHTLYDLDFAKPVPADDPAPLIEAMKAYLGGVGISPYERQRGQAERRERAEQDIIQRLDPLRRKWFIQLLRWAQDCGPKREDCIADMGLGYPQIRKLLGELGNRLTERGVIARLDDIYWLEAREADILAASLESGQPLPPHIEAIEQRKIRWQRIRTVTPPTSLPEKSFFRKILVHDNPVGNILKGYAASSGRVTARACVLHGPDEFGQMRPGDVIVAVTTTPAWTPLFAMASAVVTDIGGPLSHSSIVAREYGIPAVMATGVATRRIQTGQAITVDGSAGTVTL